MFYRIAEEQRRELASRGVEVSDVPNGELIKVPEVNKLTINYRTHNGILGAASEMVTLLLELFPHSANAIFGTICCSLKPNTTGGRPPALLSD